jgi:hypothetical protein
MSRIGRFQVDNKHGLKKKKKKKKEVATWLTVNGVAVVKAPILLPQAPTIACVSPCIPVPHQGIREEDTHVEA